MHICYVSIFPLLHGALHHRQGGCVVIPLEGNRDAVVEAPEDLPQLTVELLSALHALEEERDTLIDISVDGRVNSFERKEFDVILTKLAALDRGIRGMRIWIEHAMTSGKMDEASE